MAEQEKKKVTNSKQFEKLIEELQKNPSLARGFNKGAVPCNFKEKWNEITKILNALGPPRRNVDGWQKVWRDLKFKVKKKLMVNKAECNATGGGRFQQFILNPLDEAVANLLQFQKQLNPEGAVQGVQSQNLGNQSEVQEDIDNILDIGKEVTGNIENYATDLQAEQELPGSSSMSTVQQPKPVEVSSRRETVTPSKRTRGKNDTNDRHELLKKHSNEQARLLTDISNTMSSMRRSLKDLTGYQKRILNIEETKLKIMEAQNKRDEERSKREEEIYKAKLKIKKIEFLIKEKELEHLNKDTF